MNIFELITASELALYWETVQEDILYLGEELFPSKQILGLDLKMIKGSNGYPVVLKPSAYDVAAIPRNRVGFEKLSMEMPFFKESMVIDEETRQQLNMVLQTGNDAYIEAVLDRIFDDSMNLLKGARAQRERMRMQLLTTGMISLTGNGQNYDYDYMFGAEQKINAATAWTAADADPLKDIKKAMKAVNLTTARAICDSDTFDALANSPKVRNAITGNNANVNVSDDDVMAYVKKVAKLTIAVYDDQYIDETKTPTPFIPENTFSIFPTTTLGYSTFGTTPEQSDLLTSKVANVSIVDTGVAITTTEQTDPVNVNTKVTMIFLPSLEMGNKICIIDTAGA